MLILKVLMQSEIPEHEYGGKPIIHKVFDDCQGSRILSMSSGIANMMIMHRHTGKTENGALVSCP